MPSLEALENFKTLINSLGDEAQKLAARGEILEDVLSTELSSDFELEQILGEEPNENAKQGLPEEETVPLDSNDSADLAPLVEDTPDANGASFDEQDLVLDSNETALAPIEEEIPRDADPPEDNSDGETPFTVNDSPVAAPPVEDIEISLDDLLVKDSSDEEVLSGEENSPTIESEDTGNDASPLIEEDALDVAGESSQAFSLADFGDEYTLEDNEGEDIGNLDEPQEALLTSPVETEKKEFSLDEKEFLALTTALANLPKTLTLAIEEILLEERHSGETIQPLIDALIAGKNPRTLVAQVKKITNRTITLPRDYQKRSGSDRESYRNSLSYRLTQESWPVMRNILLVVSTCWILGVVTFMWIYRPIKAAILYEQGLESIGNDELRPALAHFFDAWDGWPLLSPRDKDVDRISDASIIVKGWKKKIRWVEYARTFRQRKHWKEAEDFYRGYLAVRPTSKEIRLEFAHFLSHVLGKYEEAFHLIQEGRDNDGQAFDRDFLLAQGDILLDWGEDSPKKYAEARYYYAKVLETSRNDERALLSMLRYQLRRNNEEEINRLIPFFSQEKPGKTKNPALAASVYSEIAKFYLSRRKMSEAQHFLTLAMAADPSAPEPFFIDALYRKIRGESNREMADYRQSLVNLDTRDSFGREELDMRILSLGGIARIHTEKAKQLRNNNAQEAYELQKLAKKTYTKALSLYSDARSRNQLGTATRYAQLYVDLGDIYYQGNWTAPDLPYTLVPIREQLDEGSTRFMELSTAIDYYNQAADIFSPREAGSNLPDQALYHRAYARYLLGSDKALVDFHRIIRRRPEDYEGHLALATVLLENGDYEASKSQYARTLRLLDKKISRTGGKLDLISHPTHDELLLRYAASWNNLGVGRARSAEGGKDGDDYAAALGAFTQSSEYLDLVRTEMDSLIGRGTRALRDDNDARLWEDLGVDGRQYLREISTFPYRNRLRLLGLENSEGEEEAYLIYKDIPSDLL